ncbi:winged helix-turn-helix transcriptional regulator [Candidatus Woesearchaeota archaeon]|nr:winged helix-turn-helix transcriptional regulator [Candidatus Woesearchaeota archaeon]
MKQDKFLLVNLEDEKSKNLANVISSDSARKILNLLTDKPLSETDISKNLNIPLTTVHYNISQLLNANLVEVHDFLWSEKGKKINFYKLSNKFIIIAPLKNSSSFIDKLKEIIPVVIFGSLTSFGIYIYQLYKSKLSFDNILLEESIADIPLSMAQVTSSAPVMPTLSTDFNYALWFFLGFLSFTLVYVIVVYLKTKKRH